MSRYRFSRRRFLASGALLAGSSLLPRGAASRVIAGPNATSLGTQPETAYLYPNPGRIVVVEHPGAVLGYNSVDQAVVQYMFDQGIMALTGITSSPANALASVFPGLTTAKKIAIKPNLINSSVPTRKEVVKAVIARLVEMLGGFPAANITVYERHSLSGNGYTKAFFGQNVNLVVDSSFPNLGYTIRCDGRDRPYSKSLHDADYLINMPVAKDHSCSSSFNFTFAFKNHMGTVNPGGSLGIHCNKKATLDIMADAVLVAKQRLVILDALYAIYNGGPDGAPQATPKKIYLSQDPVTIDAQGRILLNNLRVANGLSPKGGAYIDEAAAPPYSIGIADPALMTVVSVNLPVELTAFSGSLEGANVQLEWTTAAESANAGFEVQRSLDGAGDWTAVGFVPGKGTTNAPSRYRFTDTPDAGLLEYRALYYRLKQIDFDGKFEYSVAAMVITQPSDQSWLLEQNYPNPFRASTDIPLFLPRRANCNVEVFDAKGGRVGVLWNGERPAGLHYLSWNAAYMAAGMYLCRATVDGQSREIELLHTR